MTRTTKGLLYVLAAVGLGAYFSAEIKEKAPFLEKRTNLEMRVNKEKSVAGASQLSFQIGKGHVNSLLLATSHLNFNVTIKLKHKVGTGVEVIVGNVPLKLLNSVSNFMHGAASEKHIGEGVTEEAAELAAVGNICKLDLGSIFIESGEQLEVDIVSTTGNADIIVWSVSDDWAPHQIITYLATSDLNVNYKYIQSLFAFHGGNNTQIGQYDVVFQLTDSMGTLFFDYRGAYTASALIGRYEEAPDMNAVCLWANPAPSFPEDLQIQVSGTQAANVTLLAVSRIMIQELTSRNTLSLSEVLTARTQKLERTNPSFAKALRHAGEIVKSEEMRANLNSL